MKIPSFSVLALVLLLTSHTSAQESDTASRRVFASAVFSGGVAVFTGTAPAGSKNSVSNAFALGAIVEIPFAEDWSMVSAATIDARSMYFATEADENINQHVTGLYFSVAHGIKWKSIFFSPVIGIPFMGYQTISPDPYIITVEQSPDPIAQMSSGTTDADNFNLQIELRVGAMIPLSPSPDESWKVLVAASIPLTNFVNEQFVVSSDPSASWGVVREGMLPTLQCGFSYTF